MVVDIGVVRNYIKPKADSTLYNMRKVDLIEYIRTLEHNYNVAVSFNENQAKYIESLGFNGVVRCKDFADVLIANGVTVQKWIPVTERLPEEGEAVIVFGYWHEKFQPLMCYLSPHRRGEWFTTVAGQQVYTVTHWMPLPEPPKKGADK